MASTQADQISKIEKTIADIEGIEAARIVANGEGIEEIHVLSFSKKNVKQLTRDIESALIVKYGIAVDYRKISIAQVSSSEDGQVFDSLRLKLTSVSVESSSSNCQVGVSLSYDEKVFEGIAKGSYAGTAKYRLVAEATLRAIEKAYPNSAFALEGIELVNFGSKRAFCACISLINKGIENLCLGSAQKVDGLENESVVKAVLSAVNRRLNFS